MEVLLEAALLLCDVGEIAVFHTVCLFFFGEFFFSNSENKNENFVIFSHFLAIFENKK